MHGTWTAENLPAYQLVPAKISRTDEDFAMSAPFTVGASLSEELARNELVVSLIRNRAAAYRIVTDPVAREIENGWFNAAITAVEAGATMVRVYGRIYRMRDTAACDPQHGVYQNCPACTPKRYPVYVWSE